MKKTRKIKWHLYSLIKSIREQFLPSTADTVPILVFGRQRSGTSMLMEIFNSHKDVKVFTEHADSSLFFDFRIRSIDILKDHIRKTRLPFFAAKPICDSHIAQQIVDSIPNAKGIWMFRDYRDVANSTLRTFRTPTAAIKKICSGTIEGTGWFGEGITLEDREILQMIFRENDLSEFDLACLIWWARNRLYVRHALHENSSFTLLHYEKMVTEKGYVQDRLMKLAGLRINGKQTEFLHSRSVGKKQYPEVNAQVKALCESLQKEISALDPSREL